MSEHYVIEQGENWVFVNELFTLTTKTYNLTDALNERQFGPPTFSDEESWLAYHTDIPYIKEQYFNELIQLPIHHAITRLDNLIETKNSNLFNLAMLEDLLFYKQNNRFNYEHTQSFVKVDILYDYDIQKRQAFKILWPPPFTDYCELLDAVYTVDLDTPEIPKNEFFNLSLRIFRLDTEKSEQNFMTTVSQIIRRDKSSKYLTELVTKYDLTTEKRRQKHEERRDRLKK